MARSETVSDVSASVMTGASAGFTLAYVGGYGRFFGKMPAAALIAACTSCVAPSISRFRSNCREIWLTPNELVDVIDDSDGIWPSWRSSGAVSSDATTSGTCPRQLRRHLHRRKVDLRQSRDRQRPVTERAADQQRNPKQRRCDRTTDKWFRDAHVSARCCGFDAQHPGPGIMVEPLRCRSTARSPAPRSPTAFDFPRPACRGARRCRRLDDRRVYPAASVARDRPSASDRSG